MRLLAAAVALVLVRAATEDCEAGDGVQMLQDRPRNEQELLVHEKHRADSEIQVTFPAMDVPVGRDRGNASRRHFFVVGPEGSSTRFWSMQLAAAVNLTNSELSYMKGGDNHIINNQASLCHLSLPFGSTCKHKHEDQEEPILLDFGGKESAYDYVGQEAQRFKTVMSYGLPIFHVDPLEVVKAHRSRGELVTMLLVLRDPRATLENKVRHHCKLKAVGRKEQKKAFELMLKAGRAANDDKDIHVVCYEDIVDGGASYVSQKLHSMQLVPEAMSNVTFFNGNLKYNLKHHDCESDSLAYAELCPDTAYSKRVRANCAPS